jgi:WD40 repeat protein
MPADPKALEAKFKPKPLKVLPNTQQLCSVRFSPDGKLLAGGSFEGTVRRWDFSVDAFAELPPLTGHHGWVQAVAFHPDNKRLFAADSWGQLRCWPAAGKEPNPLWAVAEAHDGWVHGLAVSPDGTRLATCGRNQFARVWSPDDGKRLAEFKHPEDVLSLAFHPDGKSLVTGDHKGVIRQWDLATGKAAREFDARLLYFKDRIQDVGGVRCLGFDAAGGLLFAGGAQPKTGGFVTGMNLILAFDWTTGKVKHTFKGTADNEVYVTDLAWHPDGFLMAVTSGQPGNGKLLFWRPEDAQPFVALPVANAHALALHPNRTRLVVSATNANSAGNGRQLGKNKDYPGNVSPLHVFDLPQPKG